MMSRLYFFIIIILFLSFSCTENKTEMSLNIYADFTIPAEIDRIELRLFRAETEIFSKEYKIESESEMPIRILLTQENDVEELIGILVKAKYGNNIRSEIFLEKAFIRHKRVNVDIYLKKGDSLDAGFEIDDIITDYDAMDGGNELDDNNDIIDFGENDLPDIINDLSDVDIYEVGGEVGCSSGCGQNALCIEDKCKCNTGFENCNNDWSDGCEADIMNDIKYCGGCNASCNVLNVENVKCNTGRCDYDICKIGYEDEDKDRTNGCEKFNYFPKVYGGNEDEKLEAMKITSDGGLILLATTSTCCFGDKDIWVVKLDKNGDVLWQRVIGGEKEEKGPFNIYETQSGDFVIVGSTQSFNQNESSGLLIKLDKYGNLIASKQLYGPEWSGFRDIFCDKDSNCTTLGTAGIMGNTGPDLYEISIDKDLYIKSQRLFRIKEIQGDNMNILKGGINYNYIFTSKDNSNKYSIMIVMLDSNNSVYSAKELYGDIGIKIVNCVQVSSSGMYCTGYTDSTGPNKTDILLFQYLYNNKGSIGWQKLIGDTDMDFASISRDSNEFTLLMAGVSIKDGISRAIFMNLDTGGYIRYLTSFQSINGEGSFYLNKISNNLFLMGGMSFSYGSGGTDISIIPINIRGENISECHFEKEEAIKLNVQDASFSLRDTTIDEILITNFVFEDVNISISDQMIYEANSICAK